MATRARMSLQTPSRKLPSARQYSLTCDPFARDPTKDTGKAGTRFMLQNHFAYLYE